MTTQQAIEALHALPRLGQGAPGLARMQNLMDHLGNPEKDLQCIHIAGTNGKGSLAAMTSSILTAAGYKTGLTISPYVVDFRERFQIDGGQNLVNQVLVQYFAHGGIPFLISKHRIPASGGGVNAPVYTWR